MSFEERDEDVGIQFTRNKNEESRKEILIEYLT